MKDVFLALGLAFFPVTMTVTGLWLAARSRADRSVGRVITPH